MAMRKFYTLVFLKKDKQVLMGCKTRGLGEGFYNGFGGKIEKNETPLKGAIREVKEECNLDCRDLKYLGVVDIVTKNASGGQASDFVHIFTSKDFQGNIKVTDEMDPIEWYGYDELLSLNTWPHFKFWYPLMLEDSYFSAYFLYDKQGPRKEFPLKIVIEKFESPKDVEKYYGTDYDSKDEECKKRKLSHPT